MRTDRGNQNVWLALAGVALAGALALPGETAAQEVTYAGDVAHLLAENCVQCHHPGTSAPMSLETYDQVRPWAPMIKEAVVNRMMPPGWYLDRTVRHPGLQERPLALGRGDPDNRDVGGLRDADGPMSPLLPEAQEWRAEHEYWQLEDEQGWGPPDLIISSPPFTVPAATGDQWWEPDAPISQVMNEVMTEPRWVRGVETRPADVESGYVFHHANTSIRRPEDAGSPGGGFSSAAVGKRTDMYPADAGKLLLPDDVMGFSMHLFPIGREVVDAQIQVGVWLYAEGEEPKYATRDETSFNSGESRDLSLPRYTDPADSAERLSDAPRPLRPRRECPGAQPPRPHAPPWWIPDDGGDLSGWPPGSHQQGRLESPLAHDAHLRGLGAAPLPEGHGDHRHLASRQYSGEPVEPGSGPVGGLRQEERERDGSHSLRNDQYSGTRTSSR